MKTLITALLLCISLTGYTQTKTLIADETTYMATSKYLEIETANKEIYTKLTKKFKPYIKGQRATYYKGYNPKTKEYIIRYTGSHQRRAMIIQYLSQL